MGRDILSRAGLYQAREDAGQLKVFAKSNSYDGSQKTARGAHTYQEAAEYFE